MSSAIKRKLRTFGGTQHSRSQRALLSFDVAKCEPTWITAEYNGTHISIDRIVDILVVFQNRQPKQRKERMNKNELNVY